MQENGITLTADQQEAFRLDAELKTHAGRAAAEMIETGRCLCEIQERNLFEYLGAASLGEYAQKAVGFSERHAYNFIKIYKTNSSRSHSSTRKTGKSFSRAARRRKCLSAL